MAVHVTFFLVTAIIACFGSEVRISKEKKCEGDKYYLASDIENRIFSARQ